MCRPPNQAGAAGTWIVRDCGLRLSRRSRSIAGTRVAARAGSGRPVRSLCCTARSPIMPHAIAPPCCGNASLHRAIVLHRRKFPRRAAHAVCRSWTRPDPSFPQNTSSWTSCSCLWSIHTFPLQNNAAERAIRPAVIARKVSGGTRSARGSKAKSVLMSLFGTWAAQGMNTYHACKQMIIHANQAKPAGP